MSSLLRVQATTRVTLTQQFRVDGTLTDCSGAVTVVIKRLDGTAVAGSPFTATNAGTGTYTLSFDAPDQVDANTADWSGTLAGTPVTLRDYIETVGGFYFSLTEARLAARTGSLQEATRYTDADLVMKRTGVEQECDEISGHAWVPRFARFLLNGTGTDELVVPHMMVRTVRAASTATTAAGPFTALSVDELAALAPENSGVVYRTDGGTWPAGRRNIVIEYEHGADLPPVEVHDAALLRLKSFLIRPNNSIPDRSMQYTTENGIVYRLINAGPHSTGIPDVDGPYKRDGGFERVWLAR